MPPAKKKKLDDKEQTSLFSFVDKKEEKKEETPKNAKELKTEKSREEKITKKESIREVETTKNVPSTLYFKGNDEPFGLKEGNIKLTKVLRESFSSKYIRYLIEKMEINEDMERGLLLDVDYDGEQNKAYCKFYDLDSNDMKIWIDTTDHEPYCLSKESISELKKLTYTESTGQKKKLTEYEGFNRFEEIKRFDLLSDQEIDMTKIYGKTPTNIGGSGINIRNILGNNEKKAWEADIRYHLNYIFDRQLIPGLIYKVKNGKLHKLNFEEIDENSKNMAKELRELFKNESQEIQEFSEEFLNIFITPIPEVKRMAMDIEVMVGERDYKIPDPHLAREEVISISFVATDGLKKVYMLEREGYKFEKFHEDFPPDATVVLFKSEKELLTETFRLIWDYPVLLTFNGDNFDLNYLFHRAEKLKIDKDLNPIHVKRGFGILSKAECDLRRGIHVDLFNLFFNRSISGYAFGGAYESASLNAISAALLGEEKYQHDEIIHEMEYDILSWYNLKDSILTLDLTRFNNSLVWNLIILLCRITKMPIHDMVRRQISTWIQNIFYFEHRRKQALIPRRSEIKEAKPGGILSSKFDDDKFLGAYVVQPVPGIHFDVVVMDFASLYPSIIKEYNLSYETVQCPHKDDKDNMVRGTPYHICTHKMGIFAYVVGFFRDIRVKYFKPKSSDKSLSEKQRNYYLTIQQALKVFINGSYGVFGSQNFPLFCLPVAESTTGIGQYSIKQTINKAQDLGVEVLYGDSIIGDRCIVIKKEDLVDVIPIELFWYNCEKESETINDKEVKSPESIYTLSKDGEWQLIKKIVRHKTNKKIYRVNQKNGETICTEDHSLISEDLEEVKPSEIKNRKILYLEQVPLNNHNTPEIIDLYPLVKHFSLVNNYKNKEKISRWWTEDDEIWFGWTNRNEQKKIKRFCKIDDLCKLLGIYIADGHSSHHKGKYGPKATCGISSKNVTFLLEIKALIEKININYKFDIIETTKKIRNIDSYSYRDNTHRLQTNSTTWAALFDSLCGSGATNKHLPSFIFNVEKKYQKLLYEYYLKGDGSIDNGNIITFTSKSLRLICGLCYLLKSWGTDVSIYYYEDRDVYRIRERKGKSGYERPIKTKLTEIMHERTYVFDLSVENTEMFVDACGMMMLHNTDSVFLKNPSKSQMKEISDWSKKELDLDLEEEKTYQFLALSERKKNYVGIYKDTKYTDIKGLVAKKKNTPEFIKTVFSELIDILKTITNNSEFLKAKDKIIEIVRTNIKKIGKPDTFNLEEYAINIALQKDLKSYTKVVPQHVRAALELRDVTGKEFQKGETISFIKSKGNIGAKALELAKLQDIDTKKYKELLISALEQVLDALGITYDEIKGIKKMDAFF
jgi:DNA polymerase I